MDLDLTPKTEEAVVEGDGGGHYNWSSSLLAKDNLGAGRLVLHPRGFALPHYADTSKVGYVIQGTNGVAGMVVPNTGKEVVVKLKQGDVIPVPIGTVSWWFNEVGSILGGFSTELTSKIYNLNKDEADKLTKSQTGTIIIKVDKGQHMPEPHKEPTKELVYNIDAAHPDYSVTNGGLVTTLTQSEFPFIGEVGLSVIRVKLEPNAIKAPSHSVSPVAQLIYIARGGGNVEIVGLNGQRVLDTQVKAGQLLLVPQFFVVAEIAGDEGMESYSIVATLKPMFEQLAGRASVWGAMSPTVQQVALNVDSDFQKLFMSKIEGASNLIPSDI